MATKTKAKKTAAKKPAKKPVKAVAKAPPKTVAKAEKTKGIRAKGAGAVRVGIGGWTFEPWRGVFYPEGLSQKRELEFASRQLTSIEINGT